MRDYELVVILSPEITEEKLPTAVEKVSRLITDRGGTLVKMEPWGKRRLAYPLKHFTEGNYLLAQLKMEPASTKELESSLRLSEEVLRHLLVKVGE